MAFELETPTKVKILDVRTLSKKDRKPDELPGAQLLCQATLPAESLTMFDGFLAGMLYRKATPGKQGKLEGMEGNELTAIGQHVKRLPWTYEQTGCSLLIDRGLGGKRSNIEHDDVKVHRVSFQPQQGGGVKVQWTEDIPNLSDDIRGKLTGLKSTEVDMLLSMPEVAQEDIEDAQIEPAKRSRRTGNEAGDAFAAAHTH